MKHDPKLMNAVYARHSVRKYHDRPIAAETAAELQGCVEQLRQESGLNLQLFLDEPKAFGSMFAHFGFFAGVRSYLALVGPDDENLDEACGYWGEKFVLKAQLLGLNTCWVGGTYKKSACPAKLGAEERLALIIAVGYGKNQGSPHRSKALSALCSADEPMPDWFARGMESVLLAPTAINQQAFKVELLPGNLVRATAKPGPFSKVDLGIVKLHFEIGAGEGDWKWTN